jgi:predicted nucleic acid-binding Zn ribbon protein
MADRDQGGGAEKLRAAREALAAARAQARAKGLRPSGGGPAGAGQYDAGPRPAGQPGRAEPEDPAAVPADPGPALADRGAVPADRGAVPAGSELPQAPRAARRVRRDDPQALSAAIEGLLDAEGWNLAAATGSVFGRWAQIVGPDLAAHTRPESLRDGELTVSADSTAWATQLRLLAAQLVYRLNAELGAGTVRQVKVRGPVTAPRKPGEWRVRGSRGPRDTYG